ncbi:MAG TPA: asparagine synthase (glutamine-hydrolyzing) [Blastocatellia bacterium]|nr:asparagine synthase (glutamine-hydrolyzing) [Blastocatellia bacterium]
MCGIVGIMADLSGDECLRVVRRMNKALEHRGPDDEGVWSEAGFGFGMRRLSIIDLSGGHQPMWDEQGDLGVVLNGEIYNYKALTERLGREGWRFRTASDTEVALAGVAAKGLDAVHSWNGMFAVAAFDRREKRLLIIRDRMGVKPLYYFWDGQTFMFASEIKALLASQLAPRRVNNQALWDYLTFRYTPGPETIWEGIRKLPPGHALEVKPGQPPREIRYWSTDVFSDDSREPYSEKRADEEFASLFLDAVQLRLVASDVPVGVLLSGGLDSSAVAAAAVELGHRNFHTFSVGFDDGGYESELPYARQVARHTGARYHEVVIGRREFLEMLPELVHFSDEPLADLASVPLLAVCRLARQDVKVVLSGEGSDEVLAGYDLDRSERGWELARALQRIPSPVLKAGALCTRPFLPERFRRHAERIAYEPLSTWNRVDRPNMTRVLGEREKEDLWPASGMRDSDRILRAQYGDARSDDPLQQLLSVYQKGWLIEDLLMKADKMSMATSLELRTPFLDYRLVEWANRQPNAAKVRRTGLGQYTTKSVLRRFAAGRLPEEILNRPKRGFPVPAYSWVQNGLADWARDLLVGPDSRVGRAFRRDSILRHSESARGGSLESAHRVWSLVVLEYWLRKWEVDLA